MASSGLCLLKSLALLPTTAGFALQIAFAMGCRRWLLTALDSYAPRLALALDQSDFYVPAYLEKT